jgi:hypothetical protein
LTLKTHFRRGRLEDKEKTNFYIDLRILFPIQINLLDVLNCVGNPDPPVVVSKVLADSGQSYLVSWLNQNSQGVTEYTVMYRKIPVSIIQLKIQEWSLTFGINLHFYFGDYVAVLNKFLARFVFL